MDLYSFIIPTHNRCALLKECVESIKAQSYSDWECIIVNDGSEDETEEWLELLSTDDRFRVVTIPMSERSIARNKGIALSKGKFVHFIDDDDLIDKDYLKFFVQKRMTVEDHAIIRCGMEMFWPTGQRKQTPNYIQQKFKTPVHFLMREMCGVGCLSIPRDILLKEQFDPRFPHWQDTHLFIRLVNERPFYQLEHYLYFYRQHDKMGTQRIFHHSEIAKQRLTLTIEAMKDLALNFKSDILEKSDWDKALAQKYLNYAIAFASKGNIQESLNYLKLAFRNSINISLWPYYLRVPYKQFTSLFIKH